MFPGTSIRHIFVIGDETREPKRIAYLKEYFTARGLAEHVTFFQPTYKDTLTAADWSRYVPHNMMTSGRPMKAAELSIWLNFLQLWRHILATNTDGYFLIFESDVIFEREIVDYLRILELFLTQASPDLVSIGSGCDLIDDDVNTDDMNFQISRKYIMRCLDSYVYSYDCIRTFVDIIDSWLAAGKSLPQPIDNFLQTYIQAHEEFKLFWIWPSLTLQGSEYGYYPSSIQQDSS
jgi:hypothetical protein